MAVAWDLLVVRKVPSEELAIAKAADDEINVRCDKLGDVIALISGRVLHLALGLHIALLVIGNGVNPDLLLTGREDDCVVAALNKKNICEKRRVLIRHFDVFISRHYHEIAFVIDVAANEDHVRCRIEGLDQIGRVCQRNSVVLVARKIDHQ